MLFKSRPVLKDIVLVGLLVLLGLALAGFLLVKKSSALTILFTAQTFAYARPCGCCEGQMGGLPRRATFLVQLNSEIESALVGQDLDVETAPLPRDFVLLDGGGFSDFATSSSQVQSSYVVKAMELMEYDVVNLGRRETRLTPQQLAELLTPFEQTDVVSANLEFSPSVLTEHPSLKAVKRYRRLTIGNVSLFVTGVATTANFQSNVFADLGVQLREVQPALKQVLAKARPHDYVIVLCNELTDSELADIWQLARIQAIVGPSLEQVTAAGQDLAESLDESSILIAAPEVRGRSIARFDVAGKLGQRASFVGKPSYVDLRGTLADNELVSDMLSLMDTEINAQRLEEERTLIAAAARENPRYVGRSACIECHREQAAHHAGTRHAHAFETLTKINEEANSLCIGCHTTGYGAATGYLVSRSPAELESVGCESCHGPGSAHVDAANTKSSAALVHSGLNPVSSRSCTVCHTLITDPDFDFERKVTLISH